MGNIFFAHSGGVTPVLNKIAHQVIVSTDLKVLAGKNGILGAIDNELIDTSKWDQNILDQFHQNPSSIFGTCRYKINQNADMDKIFNTFKQHNIRHFIYNGGNDSQDTTYKIWQKSLEINYPLTCIGIPKTIDNDLAHTDTCPGYGSAAKYIATSVLEASLDVRAMSKTSTKVFILEVMGRNAGWLTAAAALAQQSNNDPPHILLFPEVAFDLNKFLQKVQEIVNEYGFCVVVTSEGIKNKNGETLSASSQTDAFGHKQLGGVAPYLADIIQNSCKLKTHWAVSDYLQRSAGHLLSKCDVEQAQSLGKAAIESIKNNQSGIMLTIKRISNTPYTWTVSHTELASVANIERTLPKEFISHDGFNLTDVGKRFIRPLIQGEVYPNYINGIPNYIQPKVASLMLHD